MHDAPVNETKPTCLHCKRRKANARRGLCTACYGDRAVRATFPAEPAVRKPRTTCVHCSKNLCNRPRGLCWHCYHSPGVKDKYPSTSKYARRGVGNHTGVQPLPARATTAEPGTEEKVRVMMERAARGESLFHPLDPVIERTAFHSRAGECRVSAPLGSAPDLAYLIGDIAEPPGEIQLSCKPDVRGLWVPVVALPTPFAKGRAS